jgi:UDP-N-acetylglucosamine--dolichyl-phosphate N-acetylglucosaminephosphotransferase
MPFLISRMRERGLVGRDMNKPNKPKISEMGGIGVIFGFCFGVMVAIFLATYLKMVEFNLTVLLAGFSTIALIGFLGIVDDLIGWKKGIEQWQHALIPLFAALPLMAVKVGFTEMVFPIIGIVSFGIFYSLLVVPVGITGAANAFNMLAGLNGLEAGLGILASATLLAIAFFYGSPEAVILLAAILGALIAFLRFNWFPARVFPGDSLTLMIGATLAAACIIGNMEKLGVLVMALFFIELLIKAKNRFKSECFGIPQSDGTLKSPPGGGSLTHWVMRRGRFTEKQVVSVLLFMQLLVCISVFSLFWISWYFGYGALG